MEQRQPRLGDIVDDYCPRERRITNHAVVAMIESRIRQTRCTTCDAEHEYKHAKVPPQRRKKENPAALYGQVLDGLSEKGTPTGTLVPNNGGAPRRHAAASSQAPPPEEPAAAPPAPIPTPASTEPAPAAAAEEREPPPESSPRPVEEGPVRRSLIRATLPRPEGQAPVRPAPEFTMRHANRFRGNRPALGSRPGGGKQGAGRPRPDANRFAAGPRGAPHGRARFSGKKRSK